MEGTPEALFIASSIFSIADLDGLRFWQSFRFFHFFRIRDLIILRCIFRFLNGLRRRCLLRRRLFLYRLSLGNTGSRFFGLETGALPAACQHGQQQAQHH